MIEIKLFYIFCFRLIFRNLKISEKTYLLTLSPSLIFNEDFHKKSFCVAQKSQSKIEYTKILPF